MRKPRAYLARRRLAKAEGWGPYLVFARDYSLDWVKVHEARTWKAARKLAWQLDAALSGIATPRKAHRVTRNLLTQRV